MTLIEEIDESIRLGDASGDAANLNNKLSDAMALHQKIKDAEVKIIHLFQDTKAMRKAGLASGNEISGILELLVKTRNDVNNGNYEADRVNMALNSVNHENDNIVDNWNKYLRKEIGAQKGIVETLHVLLEDSKRYVVLVDLYNEIVGNRRPGDSGVLDKIRSYKTLSNKMVKELNLKPSVMKFFEKMAKHSVLSMKEMTPEIWKWIQDNNFEDKFTIKIADK